MSCYILLKSYENIKVLILPLYKKKILDRLVFLYKICDFSIECVTEGNMVFQCNNIVTWEIEKELIDWKLNCMLYSDKYQKAVNYFNEVNLMLREL